MATTLTIYRPPSTAVVTVNIDEKTVYSKRLMGEWHITAEFYTTSVLAIQIGDFITYDSENYYINRLPDITKLNNSTFQYKIDFEHSLYNLKKKLFISSDGLADFSYNGTAEDFITNIVASINEIDSGWTVGTVDTTTEQTLQFANESCHAALIRVAEAFNLEWTIVSKAISLIASVGTVRALTFEYGRGKGLYKLTRQQVHDQNIITKVYGFGGTKNISDSYRDRAKRLVFAATGYLPYPASAYPYMTKNTDLYGTIEGQFTDDNIFPQRTSTLTAVDINFAGTSPYAFNERNSYVEDSAMDFDVNDYLIEGQVATIVFKSGDLSGVECEIWKYDDTNKRFYIRPYADTDGYILPRYNGGSPIQPQVGDSYTLVNIAMPQTYIDTAETALQAATLAYLNENSVPMVVYGCDFDQKYAKSQALELDAGDKVTVVDSDLGVNSQIRVAGVEFPLVNAYKIKATIADFVPYTLQERIIKTSVSTRKETIFVDRRNAELARRNTMRQNQIRDLLFDTDGYFDPVNLKPLSIETTYLSVGTKSRDFWLSNVTIKANYEGDANAFYVTAGSLIHLQIEISGLGYTWVIGTPLDQDSLTPATAYYLYCKCSKTALTGQWVLSSSQITVEEVAGYYHFLVGMLFAVADGRRDFDFTHGMTYINGGSITTGKIQSIDTNNYFDLTQSQFRVGDVNSSLDWNVTTASTLTIKGALVQSPAGTFPVIVFCGAYDPGVTYQKGNQVTYGGSSWNYINATPASGQTPAEGAYWTAAALAGADGADGSNGADGATGPGVVFRGDHSGTVLYYNNSLRRDIVKYSGSYYLYKGTDAASGAWSAGNWDSFGGQFSSVATDILFAELAYVDNLGVKYFNGVPVPVGDLNGIAQNIQANYPRSEQWYGDVNYIVNDKCYNDGTNYICIQAHINQEPPNAAYWSEDPNQPVKQVDQVTINSGTSGIIRIGCNGASNEIPFNQSYGQTMQDWIAIASADFDAAGVAVSGGGASAWFEAKTAGVAFSPSAYIINIANAYRGSIKIVGNEIWENEEDNDAYGFITINRKGYNGGMTRPRHLRIGNGQGSTMVYFNGTKGNLNPHGFIDIFTEYIRWQTIPTADTYLTEGEIYRDGNTLKIKT